MRDFPSARRVFFAMCLAWSCTFAPAIAAAETLPLGERLVYKISWLGIPIGIGELWVEGVEQLAGREVIHVVGRIDTNKVLSTIFPMHNEVHSWIDAETLESVQFEKNVSELLLKAHERMVFDGPNRTGSFESFTTGAKNTFAVTAPVHDVFSAVYWARRQPLALGESVHAVLSCDQKDWALEIKATRRETLRVQGESVATLRLEPITIVEGMERRGRSWINVTADASHTPVRIVYKAPFGSMVATLKQAPPSSASGDTLLN